MSDDLIRRLRACANGIGSFKSHKGDYGICDDAADRLEAQEALLKEALAALGKLHHAVCGETGFAQCVRVDSKTLYPWPALDVADHAARATLAKLRQHLEDK